jgi:DNA-binding protein HU-beta
MAAITAGARALPSSTGTRPGAAAINSRADPRKSLRRSRQPLCGNLPHPIARRIYGHPPCYCQTCCNQIRGKETAITKKAASAAAKPKAATAPVVTLKAVFEQLGETHDLPKKQTHDLLTDFVTAMTQHLKTGARIRMSGLGTLEVKTRAARTGRNPATGEAMQIKASKAVAFRAAKELKETV